MTVALELPSPGFSLLFPDTGSKLILLFFFFFFFCFNSCAFPHYKKKNFLIIFFFFFFFFFGHTDGMCAVPCSRHYSTRVTCGRSKHMAAGGGFPCHRGWMLEVYSDNSECVAWRPGLDVRGK